MTTSLSRGISTVTFFRLWTLAPTTRMTFGDMVGSELTLEWFYVEKDE
jgi:hypothetical protein